MTSVRLDQALAAAQQAGLLAPAAAVPESHSRPWPVVLLIGLGAWIAAIPLIVLLFLLMPSIGDGDALTFLVGCASATGAMVTLRRPALPVLLEQLATPALAAGLALIGMAIYKNLPHEVAGMVAAIVLIGLAWLTPAHWLRLLFGAGAAIFVWLATGEAFSDPWLGAALVCIIGCTALLFLERQSLIGKPLVTGWLAAALAILALSTGRTFLFSGGEWLDHVVRERQFSQFASVALAVAGCIRIVFAWPELRRPWAAAVAVVCIALAWVMPLGAAMLVLGVCAGAQRWRLATLAGVTAAWIIGAFYYRLDMPLTDKAAILFVAGLLLGLVALLALRRTWVAKAGSVEPARQHPAVRIGIAASLLAALAVANIGIWKNETLIATGQPVFIELGPVDPRSLMQGDYMALAFRVPSKVEELAAGRTRPTVIAQRDARGIATLLRPDDGTPLQAGEFRIQLTNGKRGWTIVTDAWYFQEGQGEHWAKARYGEFRVAPDGRALLVGMRDGALNKL